MEPVSQKWRDLQKRAINPEQSYIEINFNIGNPMAQAFGEVVENGAEFFCNPQEIIERTANPIKYAMLEPGLWILDGTYRIIDGKYTPPEYTGSPYVPVGNSVYVTADGLVYNVKEVT